MLCFVAVKMSGKMENLSKIFELASLGWWPNGFFLFILCLLKYWVLGLIAEKMRWENGVLGG